MISNCTEPTPLADHPIHSLHELNDSWVLFRPPLDIAWRNGDPNSCTRTQPKAGTEHLAQFPDCWITYLYWNPAEPHNCLSFPPAERLGKFGASEKPQRFPATVARRKTQQERCPRLDGPKEGACNLREVRHAVQSGKVGKHTVECFLFAQGCQLLRGQDLESNR